MKRTKTAFAALALSTLAFVTACSPVSNEVRLQEPKVLTTFEQSANGEKTLSTDGIVFGNSLEKPNRKNVTVYLDLGEQKSRDFLLLNSKMLSYRMETGELRLTIKPILTPSPLSVYLSEALALTVSEPTKAWDFLIDILRRTRTVDSSISADEVASFIEQAGADRGFSFTMEELQKGEWAQRLLKNPEIASLEYYPLVLVNGEPLPDSVNLNSTDELQEALFETEK